MSRMGESIAVLDGFDLSNISVSPDDADGRIGQVRAGAPGMDFASYDVSPDDADGRIGQTRAFANQYARQVGPGTLVKRNMIQASGGANYAGGSSWYPGAPTMPAAIGLASLGDGYGRAGLGDGYGRAGLGGCASCGSAADQDLSAAFAEYDMQVRKVQPGVTARQNVIDPSGGANYGGGSSFAPGMPLMTSTIGLAGDGDIGLDPDLVGYMNASDGDPNVTYRNNVLDPSGGANYGGGSSFAPGMPLLVSSAGLAELGRIDGNDRRERFPMLTPDANPLFTKLAGKRVLMQLRAHMKLAQARRHALNLARYARQFAIARRIRRAVAASTTPINAAALDAIAKQISAQVAAAPVQPAVAPASTSPAAPPVVPAAAPMSPMSMWMRPA